MDFQFEQQQTAALDHSRAGGSMLVALLDLVLNINSTRGHCTSVKQDRMRAVLLTGPGLPTALQEHL